MPTLEDSIGGSRRRTRTYDATNIDRLAAYVLARVVPVGTYLPYAGVTAPSFPWLLCDGQSLPKEAYPQLYAALNSQPWLVETATHFTMPTTADLLTFGNAQITLAHLPTLDLNVTELPHGHAFTGAPHGHVVVDPSHDHGPTGGTGSPAVLATTNVTVDDVIAEGTVEDNVTGITVALDGGGEELPITGAIRGQFIMMADI